MRPDLDTGGPNLKIWKPTREQLQLAANKTIPDVIGPGLKVVFSGINPSLYSAAVGHHFARPGNRFWPALHGGGFTDRVYSPFEDQFLRELGFGLTNMVERATAAASELTKEELQAGGKKLLEKLGRYQPGIIAFLGIESFRVAFGQPKAFLGEQPELLESTRVWVLPNPSGLNAHYQLADLSRLFSILRENMDS